MARDRRRFDLAHIAYSAAAVILGVTVERLLPHASSGRPDAIVEPRHRREITRDEYESFFATALAQQNHHA